MKGFDVHDVFLFPHRIKGLGYDVQQSGLLTLDLADRPIWGIHCIIAQVL